jgi:hypothetical protein
LSNATRSSLNIGTTLSINRGGSLPWWLSGGIAAAHCIAAYCPKGAASYAASKVNLASPGTYDAADGTAYPTWDAINGWKFNRTNLQYLTCGVIPALSWTMVIRFSNSAGTAGRPLAGAYKSASGAIYGLFPSDAASKAGYYNGSGATGKYQEAAAVASGVMAVAAGNCYRDGNLVGTLTNNASTTLAVYIGGLNTNDTFGSPITAYIQAMAIYDIALDVQISALSAIMATL